MNEEYTFELEILGFKRITAYKYTYALKSREGIHLICSPDTEGKKEGSITIQEEETSKFSEENVSLGILNLWELRMLLEALDPPE